MFILQLQPYVSSLVCVCVCETWNHRGPAGLSFCRGTGADLPLHSNEAINYISVDEWSDQPLVPARSDLETPYWSLLLARARFLSWLRFC